MLSAPATLPTERATTFDEKPVRESSLQAGITRTTCAGRAVESVSTQRRKLAKNSNREKRKPRELNCRNGTHGTQNLQPLVDAE
jgi:hypothetical protein